jgi:hypothetical protein
MWMACLRSYPDFVYPLILISFQEEIHCINSKANTPKSTLKGTDMSKESHAALPSERGMANTP